jgi:hypothetical protein
MQDRYRLRNKEILNLMENNSLKIECVNFAAFLKIRQRENFYKYHMIDLCVREEQGYGLDSVERGDLMYQSLNSSFAMPFLSKTENMEYEQ